MFLLCLCHISKDGNSSLRNESSGCTSQVVSSLITGWVVLQLCPDNPSLDRLTATHTLTRDRNDTPGDSHVVMTPQRLNTWESQSGFLHVRWNAFKTLKQVWGFNYRSKKKPSVLPVSAVHPESSALLDSEAPGQKTRWWGSPQAERNVPEVQWQIH